MEEKTPHGTVRQSSEFPQNFYKGAAKQDKTYPLNFYTANMERPQATPADFPQGFYTRGDLAQDK